MKRSEPTHGIVQPNGPSTSRNTRLMIHAVDGTIPYLTPRLLHTCFPPEENAFMAGIAVRDTCVVANMSDKTQQKKEGTDGGVVIGPKTQRGKKFSSEGSLVDSYMQPYERVIVPTFDPHLDARSAGVLPTSKAPLLELAVKRKDSDTCFVYTSSGRHRLSVKQYTACAVDALGAHCMVPLFDVPPTFEEQRRIQNPDVLEKRRSLCATNNQHWTQLIVEECAARNAESPPAIWAPWEYGSKDRSWLTEQLANKSLEGVTMVGWNAIADAEERQQVLEEVKQYCVQESPAVPIVKVVCFLCTESFQQIRQILRFASSLGCTEGSSSLKDSSPTVVIGSSLPGRWALAKKAFVDSAPLHVPGDLTDETTTRPSKQAKHGEDAKEDRERSMLDDDGCLDLNPPQNGGCHPWANDNRPILEGCTCMTCQSHSRAYLHHLVCSKEVLVEIMLFIHNLHHLLQVIG